MSAQPAARVDDPFGHSSAMSGALTGLAIGALVGVAIIATGGLGAIAIGAAIAVTGAAGLAGQSIGQTIEGPEAGVLGTGSPNVIINGRAATLTVISIGQCSKDSGPPNLLATGAATVLINGQPAGRVSEKMNCSAVIRKGSADVFIGGPSKNVLPVQPEVPIFLSMTMTAMAIGGTVVATIGIGMAYGTCAAIGSLVGGVGGSYLGGLGGSWIAQEMGYGPTGQAIGEVAGGFSGGMLGGGLGLKGGQVFGSKLAPSAFAKPVPGEPFPYTPKKMGETEPGAVPNTPELQAEMDAGKFMQAKSKPGYPDLPQEKAATFLDDVRPWDGNEHPGQTIQRVIGSDESANGPYWQAKVPATEAEWRSESAVLNNWNGNGGYVESSSAGLKGWIGTARAQMSSDGISVLPGKGEQIYIQPGSATPGHPKPTPWSLK